jgi:hypothetical protein
MSRWSNLAKNYGESQALSRGGLLVTYANDHKQTCIKLEIRQPIVFKVINLLISKPPSDTMNLFTKISYMFLSYRTLIRLHINEHKDRE